MDSKLWKRLAAAVGLTLVTGSGVAQPYDPDSPMMGPGMMGPGMMGTGWMAFGYPVELSPEQRTKMTEIQQQLQQRHWDLMGKMHQQRYRAGEVYRSGKLDEQAARKNYEAMEALRKQMFDAWPQAQKEMDALLTAEQREAMHQRWQGR